MAEARGFKEVSVSPISVQVGDERVRGSENLYLFSAVARCVPAYVLTSLTFSDLWSFRMRECCMCGARLLLMGPDITSLFICIMRAVFQAWMAHPNSALEYVRHP